MQPIEKLPQPVQLRGSALARWVLALFGWKVRLLIVFSDHITVHTGQNRKKNCGHGAN